MLLRLLEETCSRLRQNPLVLWALTAIGLGVILTALLDWLAQKFGFQYWLILVFLVIGIVLCAAAVEFIRAYGRLVSSRKHIDKLRELRAPDSEAERFLKECGHGDKYVVGKAIEYKLFPGLGGRKGDLRFGWEPKEIRVQVEEVVFDAKAFIEGAGGLRSYSPPNGDKFALRDHLGLASTDDGIELVLHKTDYFTAMTGFEATKDEPSLVFEFGHVDPRENGIPHTVCLHFVIRLSNGDILVLDNSKRKKYDSGRWSFSGEEQLKPFDLQSNKDLEDWFRRALLEELFPFRNKIPDKHALDNAWAQIQSIVTNQRVWALFVEFPCNNFSIYGVYQLNCDASEVVALYKKLQEDTKNTNDGEGVWYVAKERDSIALLTGKEVELSPLFSSDKTEKARPDDLHTSSRFRLFFLLDAVGKLPVPD